MVVFPKQGDSAAPISWLQSYDALRGLSPGPRFWDGADTLAQPLLLEQTEALAVQSREAHLDSAADNMPASCAAGKPAKKCCPQSCCSLILECHRFVSEPIGDPAHASPSITNSPEEAQECHALLRLRVALLLGRVMCVHLF